MNKQFEVFHISLSGLLLNLFIMLINVVPREIYLHNLQRKYNEEITALNTFP